MTKVRLFDSKDKADQTVGLNKIVKLQIDDLQFCLARTHKGYFAFEKSCPHMSDDLGKGRINPQLEVVCPWHDYKFDLESGEESQHRCKDLIRYTLLWEGDALYVSL
ncbi:MULTISPECIES: Rieske (2Fe-2S) protein [Reichenbachiella]|uniref:Rieske [2Fe-2S] domain-containing protein n=1 Tax=Reichenbachiella agariperforans TaxID=156994 RepID=A0A1M6P2S1_REIAG|nr:MULTISPECIES: Rieske (2Fe-2S) protein [Reichenbachiella]MBU2914695.1 Rieske (2Fe-2S) protein [Reichenbachiella agariperforans]RJE71617.1 hypothetical protein BGP76_05875 [Reichenbachiella sp. MSK19-1]SHK02214.1 Rieske [2Fe-2S] domain-containing protein [Reichenbachiella agariperforans]